ncbi:hypothetical protein BpHYR1_020963 [Brachionus plicatilis]|uniref:Uncharacterized protein n=1 Tax=Brachionus plicatilis TaxID=10195 RepID=A0A3M7PGF6_BRAPC|nr:hypothetical protein BpHYR1_020963 [Brachionus plicatilis]
MDKFLHFGKYVRVIGKIFHKANNLVVIVLLFLVAFVLSFKNLENNYSTNQQDYLSFFNSSYEMGLFKTITMMIGSLETDNMGISIDEVSELFKTAERDDLLNRIDYILTIGKFKKIRPIGAVAIKIENFWRNLKKRSILKRLKSNKFVKLIQRYKQNKTENKLSDTEIIQKKILNDLNQLNIQNQKLFDKMSDLGKRNNNLEENYKKLEENNKRLENNISEITTTNKLEQIIGIFHKKAEIFDVLYLSKKYSKIIYKNITLSVLFKKVNSIDIIIGLFSKSHLKYLKKQFTRLRINDLASTKKLLFLINLGAAFSYNLKSQSYHSKARYSIAPHKFLDNKCLPQCDFKVTNLKSIPMNVA